MQLSRDAQREKKLVALSSVGAAIGLTTLKIVVALLTGSLGIMAEAAHSGLDLIAALMTLFAVRVADRPADITHNYGHSKIENLSAFVEALLLLVTAAWVSYEAISRLLQRQDLTDVTIWAFAVMAISIVVDFTRSRVLLRVAKKLGSQALEADAIHFSTDIWSSTVVILGLLIVYLTRRFHLPDWLRQADAVAALGVSCIVIWVSIRLAKDTIDALMDKAPGSLVPQLQRRLSDLRSVSEVRRIRMRKAGAKCFADILVAAPRTLTFEQTHELSDIIEQIVHTEVAQVYPEGEVDVVVHIDPIATPGETIAEQIYYLAEHQGVHAHDIHVREVAGKLEADFDLEVQADMELEQAHAIATHLEEAIRHGNERLDRVTTHIEAPNDCVVQLREVTDRYQDIIQGIYRICNGLAGMNSAHEIHLYLPYKSSTVVRPQAPELDIVLHMTFEAHAPLSEVHIRAEKIKRALRRAYPNLNNITIHTEPPEEPAIIPLTEETSGREADVI